MENQTTYTRLFLCLILIVSVFGSGCIDYQETIEVNYDGSVDLTVYATIVKSALPMIKNRPELRQLLLLPGDESKAKKIFPPSVTIKHWVIEDNAGVRIVDAKINIASIKDLQDNIGLVTSSQNFKLYRDNSGAYQYERVVPAYPINSELGLARKMIESRLQNSNLEFVLTVPTEILKTNGRREGEKTVRWQSDLTRLRNQGFDMSATIKQPPPVTPWSIAGGILIVLAVAALVIKRR